jgi:hypothetical protein
MIIQKLHKIASTLSYLNLDKLSNKLIKVAAMIKKEAIDGFLKDLERYDIESLLKRLKFWRHMDKNTNDIRIIELMEKVLNRSCANDSDDIKKKNISDIKKLFMSVK